MDEAVIRDIARQAPPSGGSVTLDDVARVAGVSAITVSRALNRPGLVRSETQKRIIEAVRQTGYVPNLAASALTSNKSRLVALLLPTIATSIFTDMVQAMMHRLSASGYETLLGLTEYSAEREEELVRTLLGRRPDGIVLTGTDHTDLTLERLGKANVPIVEIWDLTERPIDMLIGFSHEAVGSAVALHLLQKGYKRFGIVSVDDPRGLRRSQSVLNELKKHTNLPVPFEVLQAPATLQAGREGLTRMLRNGLPDVIVCSTDTLAQGILAEAASRGLQIPKDVAVMGFGDLSTAAHVHPALSTVRVDGAAIGNTAAESLLLRFETGDVAGPKSVRVDTGFSIVDRASA